MMINPQAGKPDGVKEVSQLFFDVWNEPNLDASGKKRRQIILSYTAILTMLLRLNTRI